MKKKLFLNTVLGFALAFALAAFGDVVLTTPIAQPTATLQLAAGCEYCGRSIEGHRSPWSC